MLADGFVAAMGLPGGSICNGLPATVGIGQLRRGGKREPALVTAGDDLATIAEFLKPGRESYTAADVMERLLT